MKKLFGILFLMPLIMLGQEVYYIHCGNLFDSSTGKLLPERTVVVRAEKIVRVVKGYLQPRSANSKIINLRDSTVLPGLIDMHVHIEKETSPSSYVEKYMLNDADIAYDALVYAERTLMAGFTTIRDLGGTGVNVALRNAINTNKVKGPRIFTAEKSLATTGGHADPSNGNRKDLMGNPGPKEGVINSVDDAKKAVRQRYKNGADCIKITATGGVLSVATNSQNPQFTEEEIAAVVETANDYGMTVAAHAHGDEGMYRAVKAGVTTIEHGTLMSERTMDLMKKMGTYYVPTISAGEFVAQKAEIKGYYPEVIVPKARAIGPQIRETFAKAYKKGVPIAFGTDAGVFPHGLNATEFSLMVKAGMPTDEALQSATIVNAQLLGQSDKLGQIASGFLADIIAVKGNPLEDIEVTEEVYFVMKNGHIYKSE